MDTRALSLGEKWLKCEADHSPPSSAEVKECMELYLHSPNTPSWHDAQLKKKHRDVTFTPVKIQVQVFWVVILCDLNDEGNKVL
jgi:hypothetical protein